MVKDDHVARTISLLEVTKQSLELQLAEVDKCLSALKDLFGTGSEEPIAEKPVAKKSFHKTRGKGKNKYPGVQPAKTKKDGTQMWRASVWDGKIKKNINLGTFDDPERAFAARKKYIAQKKGGDAQVESDMQEQAENNPNRPTRKMKVWLCTHCKLEVKHPTQPMRCINVGCDSASFKDTGRRE